MTKERSLTGFITIADYLLKVLPLLFFTPPKRSNQNLNGGNKESRLIYVSGKLPTYPSPKLTLTLTSHLKQDDSFGEG